MAKKPSPWFWEARDGWYITRNGQHIKLGKHPADAPPPSKRNGKWVVPDSVMQAFYDTMSTNTEAENPRSAADGPAVAEIFEKYLSWCQQHREARTYDWYRDHIQSFIDFLDKPAQMPVAALKPFHVMEWADRHPAWSPAFRRGAIVAIQRPFNWAEKLGYIDRTPIKHIEKPQAQRREQIITPEEWVKIRDHYPEGDAFRDVLEFAWETGCRPFEVKRIEARHVQLDKHCVIFPPKEAKGKKRWRVIHMTPRAEEIIRRLLVIHPDGLLFLNAKGKPWNGFNMNNRFQRLKKHLGVKYAAYSLRHSFAQRKLEAGHDHLTVAAWMGHSDGVMLARVYSHLGDRQDHLREQLNKESIDPKVSEG
ncbi:MAG TPA: site-specific integrase [Gemmataceae bacterium]|nr:site-specific integrase [Gemmataceae bacterium]